MAPSSFIVALSALSSTAFAACSAFHPVIRTYTDRGGVHTTPFSAEYPTYALQEAFQISDGIVCDETLANKTSAPCLPDSTTGPLCKPTIERGVTAHINGWSNVTVTDESEVQQLFSVIGQAVNASFPVSGSITWGVPPHEDLDRPQCLVIGNAGFFIFEPGVSCVEGYFTGCEGGCVEDNKPVAFCSPVTSQDTLTGSVQFYFTTPDIAKDFESAPLQASAISASSSATPTPIPTGACVPQSANGANGQLCSLTGSYVASATATPTAA